MAKLEMEMFPRAELVNILTSVTKPFAFPLGLTKTQTLITASFQAFSTYLFGYSHRDAVLVSSAPAVRITREGRETHRCSWRRNI